MPYYFSQAVLYDEAPRITISDLKKGKIFQENKICKTTAEFGKYSMEVEVDLLSTEFGVTFRYRKGNKHYDYKVPLVYRQSNLGKGKVWYFKCIETGKRAFKLYLIGDYFLHRDAYPKAMYRSQDCCNSEREINRMSTWYRRIREIESKGEIRDFYKGKETKRATQYYYYYHLVNRMLFSKKDF
jgi:hypothetical protein